VWRKHKSAWGRSPRTLAVEFLAREAGVSGNKRDVVDEDQRTNKILRSAVARSGVCRKNRFNDFAKKALARICVLTSFFIASMIFVYSFFAFSIFPTDSSAGWLNFICSLSGSACAVQRTR